MKTYDIYFSDDDSYDNKGFSLLLNSMREELFL